MGIVDKVTALLPWQRSRPEPPSGRVDALAFRNDLDRWLQRVLEDPWGPSAFGELRGLPSVEVRETEDELVVTAEVPGLETQDVAGLGPRRSRRARQGETQDVAGLGPRRSRRARQGETQDVAGLGPRRPRRARQGETQDVAGLGPRRPRRAR